MSQASVRMLILMMLLAIIVAIAGSLAYSSTRSQDTPTDAPQVTVDGVPLTIMGDPAERVQLVDQAVTQQFQLPLQPQTQPLVQPTAVPPMPESQQQPQPSVQQPTAQEPAVQQQPAVDSIIFIDYPVQASDTLYSIGNRVDTAIALMARFGLSSDDVVAGNVIKLPIGNPAYCPGRRPYAVGEGDTAFSIARRFNTTHDNLRAINNLDANYTVRIAEIICVP